LKAYEVHNRIKTNELISVDVYESQCLRLKLEEVRDGCDNEDEALD